MVDKTILLTDYQIMIIISMLIVNSVCALIVIFFCYAVIKYSEFRSGLIEAIQDGDKVFNWVDAKSFGSFVAGCICAWFTMNMSGTFAFAQLFDTSTLGFVALFTTITFALWGIAWKK